MIYKELGNSGVKISALSMGGHEYLPDGRSRGFNEKFELAVKPGYLFEGFGQGRPPGGIDQMFPGLRRKADLDRIAH